VIAAALVKALRARGVRALGFKPAETGVAGGQPADSELLTRASGETTLLALPLLQLPEPLAPAVAAERAGAQLHPREIEARIELLRRAGYTLVIEGAGGVLTPLAWEKGVGCEPDPSFYTVLDLAAQTNLEAVVVGRAGLGTLNHVAMTLAMLQARKIPIRGVVLNGRQASPDLAESTNPSALARMVPNLRIIEVPHHMGADPIAAAVACVGRLIET
jgi:dethiobiotin synthetase